MKYYGYFTKKAAQALKGDRIMCRTYDDGNTIYLCNGYVLYKCTLADYDTIFRPALGRDPGDWIINNNVVGPCTTDLLDMMDKAARTAEHKLERVNLEFVTGGKPAAATIAEDRSFTALFNPAFLDAVENCDLFSAGKASAAIYAREGIPVALIMPVRIDEAQDRTIRAYVDAPAQEDRLADNDKIRALEAEKDAETARADTLQNELDTLRADLEKAQAESVDLARELEEVKQQMEREAAPVDRSRLAELVEAAAAEYKAEQEDLTPAQKAVARVEALGLTATIRGAQTAAPVVWVNGGEDRAEELKKAGAVWSGKRGAFYIRVA